MDIIIYFREYWSNVIVRHNNTYLLLSMMISSLPIACILASIVLLGVVNSHPATKKTANLQEVRRKRSTQGEPCCLVSSCNEISLDTIDHNAFQCYKTEVCGDVCRNGNFRRAPKPYSPATPGYRKRDYYMKKVCRLDQCVNYRTDCTLCPDPQKAGFSIFSLLTECIECYY